MEHTDAELQALELKARLQVKVHRTLLRHKLIMLGNSLLVAALFAWLLMLIWTAMMYLGVRDTWLPWAVSLLGVSTDALWRLSVVGMTGFKLAAILFLLCPGLGFRICGSAMKP